MIVVDASALVAIADAEPDAGIYLDCLQRADAAVISLVNATETGFVLLGRGHFDAATDLAKWRTSLNVELWDHELGEAAVLDAFLRYGKGRHPARLNLGDCFAYALARHLDVPLLYKGDDFAMTDIRSALQPT